MSAINETQIKPILRKYNDIQSFVSDKNYKKAEKTLQEMLKMKIPPGCPPYQELAKVIISQGKNRVDEAIYILKKIDSTGYNDSTFISQVSFVAQTLGLDLDSILLLKHINEKIKKSPEIMTQMLFLYLSREMYQAAQEISMQLLRLANNEKSLLLCGACSYFRAKHEPKPAPFYSFTINFLDKASIWNYDTIYMKFASLINIGKLEDALTFVKSEIIFSSLSYDPLIQIRLEMDALKNLNRFEELGQLSARFLREINSDSIDEWRLAIDYYPSIETLISELDDGKKRGPKLAQIEFFAKRGADINQLLLDYIKKYNGYGFLFGDLQRYLYRFDKSNIHLINDQAIHQYLSDEFIGDITDGRSAAMKSQLLMKMYSESCDISHLFEAMQMCEKHLSSSDARFMLLRLSGIIGATSYQDSMRLKLKLEGIQYLSLGCTYLYDFYRFGDLISLEAACKSTESFAFKSRTGTHQMYKLADQNQHYLVIEDAAKVTKEIENHVIRYFCYIISAWLDLFEDPKATATYTSNRILESSNLEEMYNMVDESTMPLFVKCESVRALLYPDINRIIRQFSSVIQVLLKIILGICGDSDFASLPKEDGWEVFAEFCLSGFQKIDCTKDVGIFVIGSIALSARATGTTTNHSQAIHSMLTSLQNRTDSMKYPEFLQNSAEEQKKRFALSIERIQKIINH